MSFDEPNGARKTDQEAEDLAAALARVREELERLAAEVERAATARYEELKPELRGALNDLDGTIDGLAERAKELIAMLKQRLDEADAGEGGQKEG